MTVNLHPEPRHPDPTRRGLLKMLAAGTAAAFIPSSHGVLMPVKEIIEPDAPELILFRKPVDFATLYRNECTWGFEKRVSLMRQIVESEMRHG